MKKKLLWVGDAACPSGFAKATHGTLAYLATQFDVTVLGINYRGDPHNYPYPIYCASVEGDMLGYLRIVWMMDVVKPDVVVLQNDAWHIPGYVSRIREIEEYRNIPIVGAIAVDAFNCMGDALNLLDHCVFWTEFGNQQAREGGYKKASSVIPLGVDLNIFKPGDREQARVITGVDEEKIDAFFVGCINRNQLRKRFDLLIEYFAEWLKKYRRDAYLLLHVAPTGDTGFDINRLARYHGVAKRVLTIEPQMFYGLSEDQMATLHRTMDVGVSTSVAEGWGLSTWEGMACGVPQVVPDHSAFTELDAAFRVRCDATMASLGSSASIGQVPSKAAFVHALESLYSDRKTRDVLAASGLNLVVSPSYRWENIGKKFAGVLDLVLSGVAV